MKKKVNILISILILLIPFFIEKFYYPNELFSISRFLFLESLSVLFTVYYNHNNKIVFKYFKSIKKILKKIINVIDNYWKRFINLKIINKLFMFLPKNILVFIFFVLSIISISQFYINNKDDIIYEQSVSDAITGPIINESLDVSFSNVKLDKKPDSICFLFATYGKKINSDYKYELYYNDGVIDNVSFNTSNLKDNDYYCFSLNNIDENNINNYHAKFTPVNVDINNVITLYKNAENNEINMAFMKKQSIVSLKLIFIILYLLIFFGINYFINKKNIKIEKIWLIYSIFYLLPILFLIPPYQVPDEPYHFENAYQLSQVDTFEVSKFISKGDITVPDNYDCLNYSKLKEKDNVDNLDEVANCFKNADNKKYHMQDKYITPSSKLGFIISSIGIKIADLLTNSPMVIFFLGRILNLLLSIVIIYYAIKISPKYKEMILSIGLMPMFVQQMVSYSYDSVLNSICLLIIALSLKMTSKENISLKKYFILFTIFSVVIISIKVIYLPLLLFIICSNDKHFNNKRSKKYLYLFGIVSLSILLSYFIYILFNVFYTGPNVINDTTNLTNFIKNPSSIFSIAKNTFDRYGMFYLRGLIGYFGWFKFKMVDMFINAYVVYFIYLVISNNRIEKSITKKIIIILFLLLIFASIFGALYFDFTAPNKLYVDGVQGRYFLPLLLPLMILLTPKKELIKQDLNITYNFVNIVLLQYILMIIVIYY